MPTDRTALLKFVAVGLVGLYLLDVIAIEPFLGAWKEQGERLAALREKVQRGNDLLKREKSLRSRWDEMMNTDLSEDISVAESDVFKSIARWGRDSKVNFTSLTPQWRTHDTGYDTFECRATATGDQASLGRLLYEIEADPLPARVEECELSARDAKGQQVNLSLKFSFVSITSAASLAGGRK